MTKEMTAEESRRAVGQVMARHRRAIGWTQVEVAEMAGISVTTLNRFERGLNRTQKLKLEAIAAAFEIPRFSIVEALWDREHLAALLEHLNPKASNPFEPEPASNGRVVVVEPAPSPYPPHLRVTVHPQAELMLGELVEKGLMADPFPAATEAYRARLAAARCPTCGQPLPEQS